MIRKLKVRIVILVVLGLALSSIGLVFAIHYINMQTINNQMRSVLNILMVNDGKRPISWAQAGTNPQNEPNVDPPERPDGMEGVPPGMTEGTPPAKPEGIDDAPPPSPDRADNTLPAKGDGTPPPKPDGSDRSVPPGNTPPARPNGENTLEAWNIADLSNYYIVRLNDDGSVASVESDRTDLYNDEQISLTVTEIQGTGNTFGRYGNYYYLYHNNLLIVLDATIDLNNADNFLRTAEIIALIQTVLLSVGAGLLIHRLVKPVDEAVEKQKQFVWDASHELKTPLAVISANAEVLSGEIGENQSLSYIQSEVERTDSLVKNLLSLARMEKSGGKEKHERINLSQTLLSVALPFEGVVFEKGKHFETSIPDDLYCIGNAEKIKELTMILLSNALKYSDEGGKIRLSLSKHGEKRLVSVFNTGEAIPQEAQKYLFDRFYRVDSSHNRELGGNGLGLAIARTIADEHHAKIDVSSEAGLGTTFTVIFPR